MDLGFTFIYLQSNVKDLFFMSASRAYYFMLQNEIHDEEGAKNFYCKLNLF